MKLCKGFWDRAAPAKGVDGIREQRRVDYGNRVSRKGEENSVPRISPMDVENPVTVAVNLGMGDMERLPVEGHLNSDVNARVDLLINLTLVRGLDGKWAVSQAHLAKPNDPMVTKPVSHKASQASQLGVIKKPSGPTQSLKQLWRPKDKPVVHPSPNPSNHELVVGDPTLESSIPSSSSSAPTRQAPLKVNETLPESIAAGVSTDSWAMLLREGTRLFMPPMPPLPLSPNPFYALSENSCLGPVLGSQSTEAWGDESSVSASSMGKESTDLAVGGVLGEEGT